MFGMTSLPAIEAWLGALLGQTTSGSCPSAPTSDRTLLTQSSGFPGQTLG